MGFHSQCIAVLAFLSLVQTFGEVIEVRHPPDGEGTTRNLTCIADDDNGALVWILNPDANEPDRFNGSTDFEPKITTWKENPDCAIWNSTGCLANWGERAEWNKVNSADVPMGRALDFRWEGFNEFTFDVSEYQLVGQVKNRTGSIVFSALASRVVHIFMCKGQDRTKGPCVWISIGRWKDDQSTIQYCDSGIPKDWKSPDNTECQLRKETQIGGGLGLGPLRWSTFTVTWDVDKGIIKVFKLVENEPFLEANLAVYPGPESTIWMSSDRSARARLHFYDYWTTRRQSVLLATEKFQADHEVLHIQLLMGLCPECKLIVGLLDKRGQFIGDSIREFLAVEYSTMNGLMTWLTADMKTNIRNVDRDDLRIGMRTHLDDNNAEGLWAIGNLRVRNSFDGVRKSTITHSRPTASSNWPFVECKNIGSRTVDEISNVMPHLYELIVSCNSVCNHTEDWYVYRGGAPLRVKQEFTPKSCINGKPLFEIVPGDRHVTFKLCSASSSSSSSQHHIGQHTLQLKERTEAVNSPIRSNFSSFPYESPPLAPDTEYDVDLHDEDGNLVISTRIWTLRLRDGLTAPPEDRGTSEVPPHPRVSSTAEPTKMPETTPQTTYLAWLVIPLIVITSLLIFICIRVRRKASLQGSGVPMEDLGNSNVRSLSN